MKEMEMSEMETESLSRIFDNYLLYSKNMVDQIEIQIQMLKDFGYSGETLDTLKDQLEQAKEQHKDTKQAVAYWKQKLNNLDDITEVYIE